MKNIHRGERAFIIGNGPGLDLYDLRKLFKEYTFGSNLIFRRWVPDYYVCCNPLVLSQYADEISNLFCRYKFTELQYTSEPIFQTDPKGAFWQGYTVTYVALQLAFIMGCDPVYLVGCDHDYGEVNGDPNERKEYVDTDNQIEWVQARHAVGLGYVGHDWNLPDLDQSYLAYQKAQRAYKNAGRNIYIIPPTKLDLFEEVQWASLL